MPGVLLLFVEVLAAPRSVRVPPTTIATNPAVALLETTVILINKQLHLCILLCEPGRVLRQAVRPKRELPRCARPLFQLITCRHCLLKKLYGAARSLNLASRRMVPTQSGQSHNNDKNAGMVKMY